jgi:two-component system OmpR family response regulator
MKIFQSHILYIEDHADTRELVTLVLGESNHRVTTAGSVKDGLNLAQEQHFDLYILDSWLPDGTGIDLCKRLREFDPGTPIMFLSGLAYEADKQAAIDHGAQRYLVKPADIRVLRDEVSALLSPYAKIEQILTGRQPSLLGDSDDAPMGSGVFGLQLVAT